ncbi:hypothetical protein [Roseburia sp. 499]|uniref:hypothetical protein n=1 Tax=Roseburia sp. 499 TaxID=1261634 RepID=UPI0009525AA6|nr:hypothetical protein [Roseburia sp. 499]WVK69494.1 hypothetical protein BIV20_14200 [Roseburia sp. 499]
MKNVELKKRFKNKYVIRVAAGAVTIAVLGTGVGGAYAVHAEKAAQTEEATKEENTEGETEETEDAQNELLDALSGDKTETEEVGKEETVYVVAKADGSADDVIVSEWLKNKDGSDTLKDASDLKDITNVKGDETFTQNGDEITWDAQGNDIYYQGTTEKELPVTEKITYYLDGKEMKPEEIAGKSGKVTIRFDYTNHEKTTQIVDGEEHEVYVPFTVMTGMILPEDYSNVEVTNGKVISDGSKKVVVGVAMPGLKDSLQIEDGDLDTDVEIPDYVEITADVENFSLDMTMSVIMNDLLGSADLDEAFDLTELEDSINTLSDSSKKLVDGSSELAEGLDTLKSSMKEFASGVNTLKSGVTSYTNGASEINKGAAALSSGINSMSQGVSSLTSALGTAMSDSEKQAVAAQADQAVESAFAGGMSDAVAAQASQQFAATMTSDATVSMIYQGLRNSELYTSLYDAACAQQIQGIMASMGVDQATAQAAFAANGGPAQVQAVVEGKLQTLASTVASGIAENGKTAMGASVADACKTAAKTAAESAAISGAEGAKAQIATQLQQSGLMEGVAQLQSGANQLAQGSSTLVSNNNALVSGANALAEATSQLADGVDKLESGSNELTEGMAKFDEEGIQKLVDAYDGDAKALLNKLTAVVEAGRDYQTFTKVSDGTKGNVKFILRTEAVKADEK